MQSILCLVFLAVIVASSPVGWASQDVGSNLSIAEAVIETYQAARKNRDLTPFRRDPIVREYLVRTARGYASAIQKDPQNPPEPKEMQRSELRALLPNAGSIVSFGHVAATPSDLVKKSLHENIIRDETCTHLEVAVYQGKLINGQIFYALFSVAFQALPELSEERLNQGERKFHITCHLCGHRFFRHLQSEKIPQRGIGIDCPKCGRRFDFFSPDERGAYHRPPWFIQGFQPNQKIPDPLSAWLFVLTHCRYVSDREQFGRGDVWQLAADTYRRQKGDCEDTSILLADWMGTLGFNARVALGKVRKGGHAWVVLHYENRNYILETTGGSRYYRRIPPRAEILTDYFPKIQFDRKGVWFRIKKGWTPDYHSKEEWSKGPS